MQVKGSYIKDESGNIISPIVSTDTAFDANGVSITDNIGDIGPILDSINGISITGGLQSKAVTISEKGTTVITPDSGYDGMNECSVTVNNIAELQEKSITISTNGTTTVSPDSGYDGMSKCLVTVSGIAALQEKSVSVSANGTTTVSPDSGYNGLSKVTVNTNISYITAIAQSNLVNADTKTRTVTIPANITRAGICVTSFCAGNSNTLTLTTTTGTVTRTGSAWTTTTNSSYNVNYRIHNDVYILTKSAGTAATVTIKASNGYGYQGMCVNAVY